MRVAVPLEMCWHDVPGGTARSAIDLMASLDRRDDVEILGVAARHREAPDAPWQPGVPVSHHRLPRLALYESWHAWRRPRVEAVTGPVDLLHVVGGAVAPSRAPLVVTIHDLAWRHHPAMFTRHGLRFFRRTLRLTVDEARIVFVPSRATFDDCVDAGIDRSRLRLVPWGIDRPLATDAAVAAARDAFGLAGDYVAVVGTLEPRKNLTGLLRAWSELDRHDLQLVVIGPEGWGDAIDASLVDDSIVMTGFVASSTRDALYRGAVASAYPSLSEGFGLPVLEAMAQACPVVTSAGTSTEELVADGAGLAVDPTDPSEIASALASIIDDPDRRAALSVAGRARAATYTWDRAADAVVAGYRDALAAGAR